MTEREIYMQFQAVQEQVDSMNRISGSLSSLADSEMAGILTSIRSSWSGDNAEAFLEKVEQLRSEIEDSSSRVRSIASRISQLAENMRDTELRNINIGSGTG